MGAKRSSAKPFKMNCGKCGYDFTVVAFLSQGVDKEAWQKDQEANGHDCDEAAKHRVRSAGVERVGQQKQKK